MISKRLYISLVSLFLLALMPTACTEGGDIGELYGVWYMQGMTVDDNQCDLEYDVFWRFQGKVISITETEEPQVSLVHVGTWQREGDKISIDFTHHKGFEDGNNGGFMPPVNMGVSADSVTVVTIEHLTSKKMVLRGTDQNHNRYYYFEKIY